MTHNASRQLTIGAASLLAVASWQLAGAPAALAQLPPPPPPAAVVPPAEPAAPEAPASTAMTIPAMTGPLVANPKPMNTDFGDPWGTIYLTGAVTGLGLFQSDPVASDHKNHFDLSNGQISIQKTEGLFQFFAQAAAYSLPALGTPYLRVGRTTGNTFGPIPLAWGKWAPSDTFSLQGGKLPTLIGAEYMYTFQNMNIERGLLWAQEPVVSRGVQANYTMGPLAMSLSLNDGFYSETYNWVSGSAAYTIDKQNTVSVVGGGNFDHTTKLSTLRTPLAQNNSTIINLIYTYNAAPWTITPYFQYTNVPRNPGLGFGSDASTYGGAILANYAINDNWNLAGRFEYIASSGSAAAGSPNLLFGPGSSAMSFTVTPTWQNGVFFVRGEASVVEAFSTTAGFAFGKAGNTTTQVRGLIEGGIVF
jgi:hypothetical protein